MKKTSCFLCLFCFLMWTLSAFPNHHAAAILMGDGLSGKSSMVARLKDEKWGSKREQKLSQCQITTILYNGCYMHIIDLSGRDEAKYLPALFFQEQQQEYPSSYRHRFVMIHVSLEGFIDMSFKIDFLEKGHKKGFKRLTDSIIEKLLRIELSAREGEKYTVKFVITKIDLDENQSLKYLNDALNTQLQLWQEAYRRLEIDNNILQTSAKTGEGLKEYAEAILKNQFELDTDIEDLIEPIENLKKNGVITALRNDEVFSEVSDEKLEALTRLGYIVWRKGMNLIIVDIENASNILYESSQGGSRLSIAEEKYGGHFSRLIEATYMQAPLCAEEFVSPPPQFTIRLRAYLRRGYKIKNPFSDYCEDLRFRNFLIAKGYEIQSQTYNSFKIANAGDLKRVAEVKAENKEVEIIIEEKNFYITDESFLETFNQALESYTNIFIPNIKFEPE